MTYIQAEPSLLGARPIGMIPECQASRGDAIACTDNVSAEILKTLGKFLKMVSIFQTHINHLIIFKINHNYLFSP
jgi:hypothetical protein